VSAFGLTTSVNDAFGNSRLWSNWLAGTPAPLTIVVRVTPINTSG
jgi:hypothetical protein